MNKSQLIDAMAQDAGISKVAAKKALESFMNNVEITLKKGGKVTLIGFGTFAVQSRKPVKAEILQPEKNYYSC